MWKIIKYSIALLAFLILAASPLRGSEKSFNIRFAVLSDAHIHSKAIDNPKNFKLLYYAPDILKTAISEINAINIDDDSSNDIDFVLFTGDSCDGNQVEYYDLFMEIVKDLKIPFYMVNGDWDYWNDFTPPVIAKNYDCPYTNLRTNLLFGDSACPGLQKRDYSIDITTSDGDLVHLIGLDNVLHFNGNRGSYEPEQLKWFEDDLRLNDSKPIIILQHCSTMMPDIVRWIDSNGSVTDTDVMWLEYDLEDELSGEKRPNEYLKDTPWRKDRPADRSEEFVFLLKYYKVPLVLMADLHLNKKQAVSYNQRYPTLFSINPALVSYPCAWTIYEMDDRSITWTVKRIEKYSQMSEEYDRRSLETFNATFDMFSKDKYTYDIEKTLKLSFGDNSGDQNDWHGTSIYDPLKNK